MKQIFIIINFIEKVKFIHFMGSYCYLIVYFGMDIYLHSVYFLINYIILEVVKGIDKINLVVIIVKSSFFSFNI